MHELGIVFHIIDSIEEVGRQNKLRRVSTVTLELGEVSGVVHTYLEDCWHWAAARSQLLNGSRPALEAPPAGTLSEDRRRPHAAESHSRRSGGYPRHGGGARRYPVRGLRQHLRHGGARQNVPFLPKPAHASRQRE